MKVISSSRSSAITWANSGLGVLLTCFSTFSIAPLIFQHVNEPERALIIAVVFAEQFSHLGFGDIKSGNEYPLLAALCLSCHMPIMDFSLGRLQRLVISIGDLLIENHRYVHVTYRRSGHRLSLYNIKQLVCIGG